MSLLNKLNFKKFFEREQLYDTQNRINTFPTLALMPIGGSRRGESNFGQLFIAEVSVALQRNDTAVLKKFRHKPT